MDIGTWQRLSGELRGLYGPEEVVTGKRDERFSVRRRRVVAPAPWEEPSAPHSSDDDQTPGAIQVWRERLDFFLRQEAIAVGAEKFSIKKEIEEAEDRIRELRRK